MNWAKTKNSSAHRPVTTVNCALSDFGKPRWNNNFINKAGRHSKTDRYSYKCSNINDDYIKPMNMYFNDSKSKIKHSSKFDDGLRIRSTNMQATTCCVTPQPDTIDQNSEKRMKNSNIKRNQKQEIFQMDINCTPKTGYQNCRNITNNERNFIYSQLTDTNRNYDLKQPKKAENQLQNEEQKIKFNKLNKKLIKRKPKSKGGFGYFYNASYQKFYKPNYFNEIQSPNDQEEKNEETIIDKDNQNKYITFHELNS